MKFYGRNQEIERLLQLDRQSEQTAVFTLLIGRRRIGKTTLVKQAYAGKRYQVYFSILTCAPWMLKSLLSRTI